MIDTVAIRNSILRLAFSGNLTERANADDKVCDLLSRVNPKKNIAQEEGLPFKIPSEWAKVKLADLYKINPKVEAEDTDEAAFIPMERISPGYNDDFSYEKQLWRTASRNHTKFQDGDVAFAKISPCFENRKSFIARELPNGIGGGTTELIILRQKEMVPEYTYYLILDQRFINVGSASYKGTVGQQRVQSEVVKNYVVPVPSVAEQKRIVEKIADAFAILDEIDALQEEYAFNQKALKSKLIELAIQGKVSEPLPNDGLAEELYQRIQAEKKKKVNSGQVKRIKQLAEITEEEKPFSVPENWKWCRLESIFNFIDYRGATPNKISSGIPFVTAKNVRQGYIDYSIKEYISEEDYQNRQSRGVSRKGDLLFTTEAPMGYAAIADLEKFSAGQRLITLQQYTDDNLIENKYYMYCVSARFFQKQLDEKCSGTTVKGIKADRLKEFLVPLPPTAEQRRIVAILDELLVSMSQV